MRRPFWERAPRLSCAGIGLLIMLALGALLFVGLAHPYIVLGIGALMVAAFGSALIFWKE